MGHSGSMLGTGLGSHIDTYAAMFRMDNAPSAYKYAQDVGRRTTYQILNHEWTGVLLNMNQDNLPHVARWWLDVATLVRRAPPRLPSRIMHLCLQTVGSQCRRSTFNPPRAAQL